MKTLSVIVPAYNEERSILKTLEKLSRVVITNVKLEVIVVDDGSKDGTASQILQNPHLYTRFIARGMNGGKGAAVKDGLTHATGDFVVFQDADLEYDPSDLGALVECAEKKGLDIVLGSRFARGANTKFKYSLNRMGNRVITTAFNLLYGMALTDCYTCYLMFRRSLLRPEDLETVGWEQHAEILCKCVNQTRKVGEVPISYHGRSVKEGKKIRARHAIAVLLTLWRVRLGDKTCPRAGYSPSSR